MATRLGVFHYVRNGDSGREFSHKPGATPALKCFELLVGARSQGGGWKMREPVADMDGVDDAFQSSAQSLHGAGDRALRIGGSCTVIEIRIEVVHTASAVHLVKQRGMGGRDRAAAIDRRIANAAWQTEHARGDDHPFECHHLAEQMAFVPIDIGKFEESLRRDCHDDGIEMVKVSAGRDFHRVVSVESNDRLAGAHIVSFREFLPKGSIADAELHHLRAELPKKIVPPEQHHQEHTVDCRFATGIRSELRRRSKREEQPFEIGKPMSLEPIAE